MTKKFRFHLAGLTCSHCAMKIEEKMGSYPFVESSVMNFIAQELTLQDSRGHEASTVRHGPARKAAAPAPAARPVAQAIWRLKPPV